METVISLLVLGAVYSISYVIKGLSPKGTDDGGKPIFGEGFPTIDVLEPEPEPEPYKQAPERPVVVPKPSADVVKQRLKAVDRSLKTTAPVTPVPEKSDEPVRHKRLVALNNKSEAKRAFIYSEIFNRKYN